MEYTIVPMDRSHVGQIAELERECFSAPWSEAMLTEALFDAQASFIVADDGEGNILGYAGLHVVLDEGYIDNVAVERDARRHGVASALLDVFCRFGAAKLAFLTLEVRASNAPAIALYEAQKAKEKAEAQKKAEEDAVTARKNQEIQTRKNTFLSALRDVENLEYQAPNAQQLVQTARAPWFWE